MDKVKEERWQKIKRESVTILQTEFETKSDLVRPCGRSYLKRESERLFALLLLQLSHNDSYYNSSLQERY
jgi:hypothetical protein